MIKLQLISRGNTLTNRFSKALVLRQTGEHYRDVGFCEREESASLRHFNYSYQRVLDFQRRLGTVHIQATQWIKPYRLQQRNTQQRRQTLWCKDWKGGGWMGRAEERRKWTKQQSNIDWRPWNACGHPPAWNKIKDLKFTSSAYLEQTLSICGHICATPNFRLHFRLHASKQPHKIQTRLAAWIPL